MAATIHRRRSFLRHVISRTQLIRVLSNRVRLSHDRTRYRRRPARIGASGVLRTRRDQPGGARGVPPPARAARAHPSAVPRHAGAVDHQKSPTVSEPLSVKDIALALQLDSATLSPMLKRLA